MNNKKYITVASDEMITKTKGNLIANGFQTEVVETGVDALEFIKKSIPKGVSVMNGSSTTLEQIGYIEFLKSGDHGWNNLHGAILAEKDPAKQVGLRMGASLSDFYLGSVHALTETGEMVFASNTGSQMPHLVSTSQNLILVVGAQKIVPTVEDGFRRIKEYVYQLEDERLQKAYGIHTMWSKSVVLHKENPMMGRKVHVLIVKEKLGF